MKSTYKVIIIAMISISIMLSAPVSRTPAQAQTSEPTLITPTIYCVGGSAQPPCATIPPTEALTPSASITGTGTTTTPSLTTNPTANATSPSPTTDPCSEQNSIQHGDRGKKKKKFKGGGNGGFIELFLKFFMWLIEYILKGGNVPPPPTTGPEPTSGVEPTDEPEPSDSPEPTTNPCPEPTDDPEPSEDPSPSPTGVATPTIFGTTPMLSPTGTTTDPNSTIFVGDYETGDVSQWPDCHTEADIDCSEFNGSQHNIKAVTEPKRQGSYAGRFELRDGEGGAWSGNERSETLEHIDTDAKEGAERWYQWSTQFGPNFAAGAQGWAVITQWHDETDESPPLSFDSFSDGSWGLIRNGVEDEKLWGTTQNSGTWHDLKVHIVWSADASKGLIELWHNGTRQTFTGGGCSGTTCKIATLRPDSGIVYVKQGIYRKDTNTVTSVIFHDGFSIAKTEAGLVPLQ